jgi:hypothetical protein
MEIASWWTATDGVVLMSSAASQLEPLVLPQVLSGDANEVNISRKKFL